jgi:hypothetical protein
VVLAGPEAAAQDGLEDVAQDEFEAVLLAERHQDLAEIADGTRYAVQVDLLSAAVGSSRDDPVEGSAGPRADLQAIDPPQVGLHLDFQDGQNRDEADHRSAVLADDQHRADHCQIEVLESLV